MTPTVSSTGRYSSVIVRMPVACITRSLRISWMLSKFGPGIDRAPLCGGLEESAAMLSHRGERVQTRAGSPGIHDVALLLVEADRLGDDQRRLGHAARRGEDGLEVEERGRAEADPVGRGCQCEGCTGELLGFVHVPSMREHPGTHAPPDDLRHQVAGLAQLLGHPGELGGFVKSLLPEQ